MQRRGHCPFRVEILDHQPGCVLQKGTESLCYSTDQKPLIYREEKKSYFCPLIQKLNISQASYADIEELVHYIFTIQDQENTTINIWPMLTGIANKTDRAKTPEGKEMGKLAVNVRQKLEEIIFEFD